MKCSTMGPRARAGKKVNAPTISTVPTSRITKVRPETGKLPALSGTSFFLARFPARARTGTIKRKRPKSMAKPSVVFSQGVLAVNPAKALPLLPTADE